MQSSIEILKANHGDAFVIHACKDEKSGIIVIDGGPDQSRIAVNRKLSSFPCIDLMILTHYDNDHISGINTYVSQHVNDERFPAREVWANCAKSIGVSVGTNVSFPEASTLAGVLEDVKKQNQGFVWRSDIVSGQWYHLEFADIFVLGPTSAIREKCQMKYEAETKTDVSDVRIVQSDKSLEELSRNPKMKPVMSNPHHLVNMDSIAILLKCDGLTALFLGDTFPCVIIEQLKSLAESDGGKLKLDVLKVSHHGSKNNISNEMLDLLDCNNYIITTNGGSGNSFHPDRESLANILLHPTRNKDSKVNVLLNYGLDVIENRVGVLLTEDEKKEYNCEIIENISNFPVIV